MHIKSPALVLHTIKYSEADLIARIYTKEVGLKSYVLKGIQKSKKGKLKKALFVPLTLLEIEANHKDKGSLEYLKEAQLLVPYSSLHTHVIKQSLVMFLAEVLQSAIQEEEQNKPLFDYLATSLIWLDNSSAFANFHIVFLLELSSYLGFYPDDSTLDKPCFNLEEGRFTTSTINPLCICSSTVDSFKLFFGIDFDASNTVKLNKNDRLEVLNLLLQYYQLHLQNYKTPRSLAILNQLF